MAVLNARHAANRDIEIRVYGNGGYFTTDWRARQNPGERDERSKGDVLAHGLTFERLHYVNSRRDEGDTTVTSGRLDAIWLKRAHRGKMDEVTEATAVAGQGLAGSVGRSSRRQVTLIERERWESYQRALGLDIAPSGRRANLMVSGITLARTRGRVLRVGAVRLAIGGETTPCERMEEVAPGLRDLMRPNWGGGAYAQVLDDGIVTVGDAVFFEDEQKSLDL